MKFKNDPPPNIICSLYISGSQPCTKLEVSEVFRDDIVNTFKMSEYFRSQFLVHLVDREKGASLRNVYKRLRIWRSWGEIVAVEDPEVSIRRHLQIFFRSYRSRCRILYKALRLHSYWIQLTQETKTSSPSKNLRVGVRETVRWYWFLKRNFLLW